jgi:transcriptional regulator of aromatic amino acid metabolism
MEAAWEIDCCERAIGEHKAVHSTVRISVCTHNVSEIVDAADLRMDASWNIHPLGGVRNRQSQSG